MAASNLDRQCQIIGWRQSSGWLRNNNLPETTLKFYPVCNRLTSSSILPNTYAWIVDVRHVHSLPKAPLLQPSLLFLKPFDCYVFGVCAWEPLSSPLSAVGRHVQMAWEQITWDSQLVKDARDISSCKRCRRSIFGKVLCRIRLHVDCAIEKVRLLRVQK